MHLKRFLKKRKTVKRANIILFILVLFIVLIAPIFPSQHHGLMFGILLSFAYVMSVISLKEDRIGMYAAAMSMIFIQLFSNFFDLKYINLTARMFNILFFLLIIVLMVYDIFRSKKVNAKVILQAVNIYLMLGIIFALLITILMYFNPDSFSFQFRDSMNGKPGSHFGDFIYYSFVTLSTLGYGEIIPLTPIARSIAVLASVTGPMYLTVVIAMLVGKFANKEQN